MYEILLMALGLMVYSSIGVVVGKVTMILWDEDFDTPGPFFAGLLWPLVTTALFPFYAVSLSKKIGLPRRKTAEQKVIEYSQSPSKILTEIICAKIIAHIDGLNWSGNQWVCPDEKIDIRFNLSDRKVVSIQRLIVNRKEIPSFDVKKICDSLNKCREAQGIKIASDRKAAEELAALEAVETLLLTPEKTVEHPMGSHS